MTTATEAFFSGLSPRDYLKENGWEFDTATDFEGLAEGWMELRAVDPIYGQWECFGKALIIQHQRDIERLGGYAKFMELVEKHGVDLEELSF